MSVSAQLTSEQLKEISDDEMNTDKETRVVKKQLVDDKEVVAPENTNSVLNRVPNTFSNTFQHTGPDNAVRFLHEHAIRQSSNFRIAGGKYSIPCRPRTMFLDIQVCAIWFIVRIWIWDADMPGALVADELGLGKTFTSVAAALHWNLVPKKVVMGLPLSMLLGNTFQGWAILAHSDITSIVGDELEWYQLQRLHSIPHRLLEIQSEPPHVHPVQIWALEPILVVTMPRLAKTVRSVIDEMTHGTYFKLVNIFQAKNANLTHKDLNTSID